MRAENRHFTRVWKTRRKHKLGDKCKNPGCLVCHSDKLFDIPDRKLLRENSKIKTNDRYSID